MVVAALPCVASVCAKIANQIKLATCSPKSCLFLIIFLAKKILYRLKKIELESSCRCQLLCCLTRWPSAHGLKMVQKKKRLKNSPGTYYVYVDTKFQGLLSA